jgi:hypothetical protein
MKNLLKNHTSSSLNNLDFDNSVTYRSSFSRAAKRPKLSTLIIRSLRSNWQNMERLASVAVVVGSFALGFPVSTVHAEVISPQVGIQIAVPEVGAGEPFCSYGYYGYAPYECAPYGYWGPEFFYGGHFRGAGPWEGHGRDYNRGNGESHYQNVRQDQINHGQSPGREYHGGSNGGSGHQNNGGDHGDRR